MTSAKRVVVGVDGSEASRRALTVAFDEARLRSAGLTVLCAYEPAPAWPQPYGRAPEDIERKLADYTRATTETVVHEVLNGRLRAPGSPDVDIVAVPGPAQDRLVEASEGSSMLVLGSRGHGRIRSAVAGSIGLHCLLQAACPVLVVGENAAVSPTSPSQEA